MRCTRREMFAVIAGGLLGGATAPIAAAALPERSNRVVSARLASAGVPGPDEAGALLDRSITALTGADDEADAWRSLFSPSDHVSIKVNCLGGPGMSTSPVLVGELVARLKRCGIAANRIIVWDRLSRELREAGFRLARGGGSVQCYGTDEAGYGADIREHGSVGSLFSTILTERCNKVVNMPVLKDHGICGMTFALKNFFGAIHNPNKYHLNRCNPYIGDLNAMPLIRERQALIVGDLARIQADGGPSFKEAWAVAYGGVIVGRDPVAVDAVALEQLERARLRIGKPPLEAKGLHPDYLEAAARSGAGTLAGAEHIEIEV